MMSATDMEGAESWTGRSARTQLVIPGTTGSPVAGGMGVLGSFLYSFSKNFLKFIYLFLAELDLLCCTLTLIAVNGAYSSLWWAGFSLWWLLLLWSTGPRRTRFSSCGA